jgi:hypothetical protein
MQRNLTRIQRDELIKRNSGGNVYSPKPAAAVAAGTSGRGGIEKKTSFANYGYGERDDMIGFINRGKKPIEVDEGSVGMKMEDTKRGGLLKGGREGNLGKWEVMQIISKGSDDEGGEGEVKQEEVAGWEEQVIQGRRGSREEGQKRERKRTPDTEDLLRFKVEEKSFPGTEVKEEGEEEVKTPVVVGFKKRKIRVKNARVSGAL